MDNLHRIVTLIGVAMIMIVGSEYSYGGSPMTDLPTKEAEATRKLLMSEIPLLDRRTETERRQICSQNRAGAVAASYEAEFGKGSHPQVPEYCTAIIANSIKQDRPLALYGDLALQQLGLGRQTVMEGDADRIGDHHTTIQRSVRRAANTGQTTYPDVQGVTRPLPCPLAFDAGAVSGGVLASTAKPVRVPLTKAQITTIAEACYNPAITAPTPAMKAIGAELAKAGVPNGDVVGANLNVAGLLAGEAFGHGVVLDMQNASKPAAPSARAPRTPPRRQSIDGTEPPARAAAMPR